MMKKRILIALGCLIVLLLLLLGVGKLMIDQYGKTPREGNGQTIVVDIPPGLGPKGISALLAQKGVVEGGTTFYRYVRFARRVNALLKAGELGFRDNMSPDEVIKVLMEGIPVTHKITVPEGLRLDEIAVIYEQAGLVKADAFLARARDPAFARSLRVPAGTLEGYLYPETYHFRKRTAVDEILTTMVQGLRRMYTADLQKRARELGMSELQVLTLASIVEKETGAPQERPFISGVFHNRLRKNWRMDTDPSVIYAVLLARGNFDGNLTRNDLALDHPYNTYRHKGLPPGPICNPGGSAIQAALYPTKTDAMFFVSKNDGTHRFCPTLSCHNKAVETYQGRPRSKP
jgi:UPF0755 protein